MIRSCASLIQPIIISLMPAPGGNIGSTFSSGEIGTSMTVVTADLSALCNGAFQLWDSVHANACSSICFSQFDIVRHLAEVH